MRIPALILAAGRSERMGTQKMLLQWGEKTILEHVVAHAMEGGIEEVVVVTGCQAELVENSLRKTSWNQSVHTVYNPDYHLGMLSSVQCGIRHMIHSDAVLIALGDQPTVPSAVFKALISVFPECGKGILIPKFRGKRGHPIIIHKKHFSFILGLDPKKDSLHQLTNAFPDDIFELEVESPEILHDIDAPQDLKNLTLKEQTSDEGF
ncbi:MAG: nucleotidyltransferase family protein [bacterium]